MYTDKSINVILPKAWIINSRIRSTEIPAKQNVNQNGIEENKENWMELRWKYTRKLFKIFIFLYSLRKKLFNNIVERYVTPWIHQSEALNFISEVNWKKMYVWYCVFCARNGSNYGTLVQIHSSNTRRLQSVYAGWTLKILSLRLDVNKSRFDVGFRWTGCMHIAVGWT